MRAKIGVDVGGTNTDAVALAGNVVVGAAKAVTSSDVTQGIVDAIKALFDDVKARDLGSLEVERVHIGTTHFINAVIQRRNLDRVSVIRLCLPATTSLPPFVDFPPDLKKQILGTSHMVNGGFNFDGRSVITEIDEGEIVQCVSEIKEKNIKNIVISGVFSPANVEQEQRVGDLIRKHYPECTLTLSNEVAHLGLLERENASILNESLKRLCYETVEAFKKALSNLNLNCPLYLTQNDGTLLSASQVLELPIRTFSSGPTNSMRGAAQLSGLSNAIVVDIGGTTTDVGVLISSLPRESATQVRVGGVRTNFRMPDVLSFGLGGGSMVQESPKVIVGPESVGYKLTKEALVFGGSTLTATDIAVAGKLANIGSSEKVAHLNEKFINEAKKEIQRMIEDNIDQMKTTEADVDVILVGGGSILVDESCQLKGVKKLHKPDFYEVANAVGAALSQVSGSVDMAVDLHKMTRDEAVAQAKAQAIQAAINVGAVPDTVEIVDFADIPAAYQPNDATRIKVKAVGSLAGEDCEVELKGRPNIVYAQTKEQGTSQPTSKTSENVDDSEDILIPSDPRIDQDTGRWVLSEYDAYCLATGAGILGCGGGGNPTIGRMRVQQHLHKGKKIEIIAPERLSKEMTSSQRVISVAFMGAPLVIFEKICNGQELRKCAEAYVHSTMEENKAKERQDIVEEGGMRYISDYGVLPDLDAANIKAKLAAICSAEIGGLNCMEPLTVGADLDVPIVDADGMGRAFPELQMFVPFINGKVADEAMVSDEHGNVGIALKCESPKKLEDFFRKICIQRGCSVGVSMAPMGKSEIESHLVPHTLSQSWRLGNAVLTARRNKTDPVQAVIDNQQGKLVATGKVIDVQRKFEGGFNRGLMTVHSFGSTENERFIILFQNENLVIKRQIGNDDGEVLVCTPDLICVVGLDTGEPIPTEELRYGLRVAVLALPAPPQLRTDAALAVVGPQAFGYPVEEVKYKPLGEYIPTKPIPLV